MILNNHRYRVDTDFADVIEIGSARKRCGHAYLETNLVVKAWRSKRSQVFFITMEYRDNIFRRIQRSVEKIIGVNTPISHGLKLINVYPDEQTLRSAMPWYGFDDPPILLEDV